MEKQKFDIELWCSRLIENEGLSLMPYYCPLGKLTIGVGHNLEDNPLTNAERIALGDLMHGITENGAKMLLRRDIKQCLEQLKKNFKFYNDLTSNRQYALLDMCFQLGIQGLKKFKLMLSELEKGNYDMAAYHCLKSLYAKQTPKRAKKIAAAIKTDTYPDR